MSLGVDPASASALDAWYQKVSLNPPLVLWQPPSVSTREQGAFNRRLVCEPWNEVS